MQESILAQVRSSTEEVVRQSQQVGIDPSALDRLARQIATEGRQPAEWDTEHHYRDASALTVQYLLVLDAMNFCFWPDASWNYNRLALALKEAVRKNAQWISADSLAEMTPGRLGRQLGSSLPLLEKRAELLREVGRGLQAGYQGQATCLVEAAVGSADRLVARVAEKFPGFRDEAMIQDRKVLFYKRAQIFVGDLWGSFGGESWGAFQDISLLTTFADYRVPQLLRHLGVLSYREELSQRVDRKQELEAGDQGEIEIRAATIRAVELLRDRLEAFGHPMTCLKLDWLLWQQGEKQKNQMKPHHRTISCFY